MIVTATSSQDLMAAQRTLKNPFFENNIIIKNG